MGGHPVANLLDREHKAMLEAGIGFQLHDPKLIVPPSRPRFLPRLVCWLNLKLRQK